MANSNQAVTANHFTHKKMWISKYPSSYIILSGNKNTMPVQNISGKDVNDFSIPFLFLF